MKSCFTVRHCLSNALNLSNVSLNTVHVIVEVLNESLEIFVGWNLVNNSQRNK
jgi:hypothetical protein